MASGSTPSLRVGRIRSAYQKKAAFRSWERQFWAFVNPQFVFLPIPSGSNDRLCLRLSENFGWGVSRRYFDELCVSGTNAGFQARWVGVKSIFGGHVGCWWLTLYCLENFYDLSAPALLADRARN